MKTWHGHPRCRQVHLPQKRIVNCHKYVVYNVGTYLVIRVCSTYLVSGKKLAREILNKIVSICRIGHIFYKASPQDWRACGEISILALIGAV